MKSIILVITLGLILCSISSCGKIDPEKDSSSNSINTISAYDNNGINLGKVIMGDLIGSQSFSVFNSQTNGHWIISMTSGKLLVGSSALSQYDCYYESTDCSGVCYMNNSLPKNIVVGGPSSTFFKATSGIVSKTANSGFDHLANTCTTLGAPVTTTFKVSSSYQFPSGVTYPFLLPIYFE